VRADRRARESRYLRSSPRRRHVTGRVTALPTTAAVQAAILHAVRLLDGRLGRGIVVLRLFRRDRGRRAGHQRVDERHVFVHFGRGARQQHAQLGGHPGGRWRVDPADGRQHARRGHHRRFFLYQIGFCGNNKQNKRLTMVQCNVRGHVIVVIMY